MSTIAAYSIVEPLGWTLVHFLWQGLLIAAVVRAALALMDESSAQTRYLSACLGLLAMVGAPVATATLLWPSAGTPAEAAAQGAVVWPVVTVTASDRFEPLMPWLVMGWAAGVLICCGRLLGGWMMLERMKHSASIAVADELSLLLDGLARRMRVSRPVRLAGSALVQFPVVIGWLRPVILIPPAAIAGLSPEQLEAVLAHELAHIRRWDALVNMIQRVVESLLFYHPAVWWLSGRIRQERENCCDDAAAEICGSALGYAKALHELESRRGAPALALAATGGDLAARIRRLLGGAPPATRSFESTLAAVLVVVFVLGACATLRSQTPPAAPAPAVPPDAVEAAQQPPPPPPPPAARPADPRQPPPPPPPPPPAPRKSEGFAIITGDKHTISGSRIDHEHVEALKKKIGGDFLWFRQDGKSWVVRDAATMQAARAAFRPQEELGEKQAELGRQQAKLGRQQAQLGEEQRKVQVKMPELEAQVSKIRAEIKSMASQQDLGRLQAAIGEMQSRVGEMQARAGEMQSVLGEQQARLGAEQGRMGAEQGRLGQEQARLAREATDKMRALLKDAIARGLATPEP